MSSFLDCSAEDFYIDCCENNFSEGRIDGAAWVKKGVWEFGNLSPTTISSDSRWQALVANKLAYVIPSVKGQYDGSTAVEGAGYGRSISRLTGRNHQASYSHLFTWTGNDNTTNFVNNVNFYNWLNRQSDYEFYFTTQHHIWRVGAPSMSFTALPISESIDSSVEYVVTVKWSKMELPTPYLKCVGSPNPICLTIFDRCELLDPTSDCWNPDTIDPLNCTQP